MSRLASYSSFVCVAVAGLVLGACGDEPKRRIGSTCNDDPECGSGTCYEGQCIDPGADDDLDTLLNGEEIRLGTDPFDADSDRDGERDPTELAATRDHLDQDADGTPDALESQLADRDADCIADELDAEDDSADPTRCPEVVMAIGTPSDWYTSEAGRAVTVAVALAAAPERPVDVVVTSDTEADVTPVSLHFTVDDWARPRQVTVTGADDASADGHVDYQVYFDVQTPFLRGAASLSLVNADNDLPTTAAPADDFGNARTAGLWRDEPRQRSDTRIVDGALVHAIDGNGTAESIGSALGLDVPLTTFSEVGATLRMTAADGVAGRHEAVVRLLFQPAANRGASRAGLVAFEVALGVDGAGAPRALPRVWSCADEACVTPLAIAQPTLVSGPGSPIAVALDADVAVGLHLDRATDNVRFSIGTSTFEVDFADGPITADDLVRVELGAFASPDGSDAMAGVSRFRFDGVKVDGATWDDFTSGRLADGRWLDPLMWNALDNGALALETQGDSPWFDSHLQMADATDIAGVVVTMTLEAMFDPSGAALGGVLGGRVGSASAVSDGETIEGPLEADVVLFGDRVVAVVRSVLGVSELDLAPATVGTDEMVMVLWDGRDLTFQAGGDVVLVRPERWGLAVDPDDPALGVSVQGFPEARTVAHGRMRVDDVAIITRP